MKVYMFQKAFLPPKNAFWLKKKFKFKCLSCEVLTQDKSLVSWNELMWLLSAGCREGNCVISAEQQPNSYSIQSLGYSHAEQGTDEHLMKKVISDFCVGREWFLSRQESSRGLENCWAIRTVEEKHEHDWTGMNFHTRVSTSTVTVAWDHCQHTFLGTFQAVVISSGFHRWADMIRSQKVRGISQTPVNHTNNMAKGLRSRDEAFIPRIKKWRVFPQCYIHQSFTTNDCLWVISCVCKILGFSDLF